MMARELREHINRKTKRGNQRERRRTPNSVDRSVKPQGSHGTIGTSYPADDSLLIQYNGPFTWKRLEEMGKLYGLKRG